MAGETGEPSPEEPFSNRLRDWMDKAAAGEPTGVTSEDLLKAVAEARREMEEEPGE